MSRKKDLAKLARFNAKVLRMTEKEARKELAHVSTKQIRLQLVGFREIQLRLCEKSYRDKVLGNKKINESTWRVYALLGVNSFVQHDTIQ